MEPNHVIHYNYIFQRLDILKEVLSNDAQLSNMIYDMIKNRYDTVPYDPPDIVRIPQEPINF